MSVFNPGILVKLTGQETLPKLDEGLLGCSTNCQFSCDLIIFQLIPTRFVIGHV